MKSVLSLSMVAGAFGALSPFDALVAHVNAQNSSWVAEVPRRFASPEHVKVFLGTILKGEDGYSEVLEEKLEDAVDSAEIPTHFDVREQWPDCAPVSGHVRDQSACGSCWAFGSTEAFNDRLCIATGDTTLLSVEDTIANCGFLHCLSMGCGGGQPGAAWRWLKNHGVVSGGDFYTIGEGKTCAPYPFEPCSTPNQTDSQYPTCHGSYKTKHIGHTCTEANYPLDYKQDKRKASSAYSLKGVENIQRDILKQGSVTAAFSVYADFPAYKSGVYRSLGGGVLGGHAVKILGWGVEDGEDYWLVMNSWNEEWGEKGFFRIVRGENHCGIEGEISAGTASPDVVSV